MNDAFTVRVGEFEGPLELLLSLIERKKMHVSEVSLAAVTDNYLEHIAQMTSDRAHHEIADFVAVAATLLLIKSLSLLPTLAITLEETESIKNLEDRLANYERIRNLAKNLSTRFGKTVLYPRGEIKQQPLFTPTKDITKEGILAAIHSVLRALPKPELLPKKIIQKTKTLEEVLGTLLSRVQNQMTTTLKNFVGDKGTKSDVILGFLAVLELVRRGTVIAKQDEQFSDIHIETQTVGVPHYGA